MNINRWSKFTLFEQMSHIGSEIERARICEDNNDAPMRNRAIERAFDLIDVSLQDSRWRKRSKEFCRLREILADHYWGEHQFSVSADSLRKYFLQFAFAARKDV